MTTDAGVCERVTREHARTFFLASRFLPARKRRAAFAVYAFCREADDIVDAGFGVPEASPGGQGRVRHLARGTVPDTPTPTRHLALYRERLVAALVGNADGPVMREAAWAVHEFGVPESAMFELVDGVGRDLLPVQYETWDELELYCEGVASTVGVMCTHIFGVDDVHQYDAVTRYARTLGVAMQLTNVLRDVGEDARLGRCYLPDTELRKFGIARAEIFDNEKLAQDLRWQQFMRFEIARARQLYAGAYPGIAMLARDAQRCAAACAIGYASILSAIEEIQFDSLGHRAHVGIARKLGILWEAWRYNGTAGNPFPMPAAV